MTEQQYLTFPTLSGSKGPVSITYSERDRREFETDFFFHKNKLNKRSKLNKYIFK